MNRYYDDPHYDTQAFYWMPVLQKIKGQRQTKFDAYVECSFCNVTVVLASVKVLEHV